MVFVHTCFRFLTFMFCFSHLGKVDQSFFFERFPFLLILNICPWDWQDFIVVLPWRRSWFDYLPTMKICAFADQFLSFFSNSFYKLTLSQTSPGFLCVCRASLLKTQWEKDKLLVTSNLSFFHSVFYPFGKLSAIFVKFEIVVCKPFQFGRV